jgi:RNA polymerase sigma factor (sigma-70 family)
MSTSPKSKLDVKEDINGLDELLLNAFLGGGSAASAAFNRLCRIYTPKYLGRLRSYGESEADAQDICQRMFVRLWQSRTKIQIRTTARAYLLTCLRNERITWLREVGSRRRREVTGLDDFESDDSAAEGLAGRVASPEEELEEIGKEMERVRLSDCVGRSFQEFGLRFPERALAVEKQEVDGWSIEEIATVLGRTYAATKQFLSTSRKRFRALVTERCPDELTNV